MNKNPGQLSISEILETQKKINGLTVINQAKEKVRQLKDRYNIINYAGFCLFELDNNIDFGIKNQPVVVCMLTKILLKKNKDFRSKMDNIQDLSHQNAVDDKLFISSNV